MCTMANKVALLAVLLTLFVTSELTRGRLIEGNTILLVLLGYISTLIGIARPAGYVSFPPSTYDEGSYEVTHSIGNCSTRVARVGNHTKDVIICPYGELLLDGRIQTNLRGAINANRIRFFYTWEERTIPAMEAFVTLQFPGEAITPTKIVMYYLDMLKVRAHEPRSITLFSSTTESIYPEDEIQVDEMITEISSGISAQNGDYAYKKYEIQIPENRRVAMNYARISMEYEEMKWIFISEIEVYHLLQPSKYLVNCFYLIKKF